MSKYTPNKWVIVDMTYNGEQMYRILGGWSGGYLDGDSWRLGSPVVDYEQDYDEHDGREYIRFKNESGSEYICYFTGEGMNMIMGSTYSNLQETKYVSAIEIISLEDFLLSNRIKENENE